MKRLVLVLALAGCHASCDESTGAAPAVANDAGPVLGAPMRNIPATRPVMIHPIMRTPPPVDSTISPPASSSVP